MKNRAYENEFCSEKEANELFQIFPFYNVLIEIPKIRHLSNIKLLYEVPFYDELSDVEISKAFRRYVKNYKVEIIEPKDTLAQLELENQALKNCLKTF